MELGRKIDVHIAAIMVVPNHTHRRPARMDVLLVCDVWCVCVCVLGDCVLLVCGECVYVC